MESLCNTIKDSMLKNNICTTKAQGELEAIPQLRKCNEEFGSWKELERLWDGRGSGSIMD
jgi:hypothetical protein